MLSALPIAKNTSQKSTPVRNGLCIYVDTYHSEFCFYSIENGDKSTISRSRKSYRSKLYTVEFMAELTEAASDYKAGHSLPDAVVTLLLPDNAVAMDMIQLPSMNRRRTDEALDASLKGLYRDTDTLMINRFLAVQNKAVTAYSVAILKKALFTALSDALQEAGLPVTCISFAAGATGDAVALLNPKLKNASYLFLDIKHHYSRFVFVAKGHVTGSFPLPFGYSILQKNRVFSEELLFDHSVAELAVLNAREKAKAKQLTVMSAEDAENPEASTENKESTEENLDLLFGGDENASVDPTTANAVITYKTLPKKQPRKLPKFMLRPIPHDDEGFGYENFRFFIKWALNLLASNDRITAAGYPEQVLVNLPPELDYLFEMTNRDANENGIEFHPFELSSDRDEIGEYLECFGGLYAPQVGKNTVFR